MVVDDDTYCVMICLEFEQLLSWLGFALLFSSLEHDTIRPPSKIVL